MTKWCAATIDVCVPSNWAARRGAKYTPQHLHQHRWFAVRKRTHRFGLVLECVRCAQPHTLNPPPSSFVSISTIIIAHHLATVQRVDDILILEEGRVLEHGRREQLTQDPASHFARLLGVGLEDHTA